MLRWQSAITSLLDLVKMKSFNQVGGGLIEDSNVHKVLILEKTSPIRSADILVGIGLFALLQADKNVGTPGGALV
jgi:hypothetical protein